MVTLTLAVYANLAREEARQRQQQAEDLLGFMVGDLRAGLAPLGRLDLLQGVGDRAMQYFSTVNTRRLTDGELLRHAQVLTQLGEIKMEQLDYGAALASFTEAYDRSAILAETNPTEGERLFNRGQAEFWIGYVHWQSGATAEAEAWLTRYRDTSRELVALDPGRDDWLQELGYAYHNLAVLAEGRGDLDEAETGYRYLLETLQAIQARSYSAHREREIADVISFLGNIAIERGALAEASEHYRRSSEYAQAVLAADPEDARLKEEFAFSLVRLGRIEILSGDFAAALDHSNEAQRLLEELLRIDPSNTEFVLDLAGNQLLQAQALLALDRPDACLGVATGVVDSMLDLESQSVESSLVPTYLAHAHLLAGWAHQRAGQDRTALEQVELALQRYDELRANDSMDQDRNQTLVSAMVTRGELLAATARIDEARQAWQEADLAIGSLFTNPSSPLVQDALVRVNLHLDRIEQSWATRESLAALGYVPVRPWPESAARR